jgi:hypothetical protein
VTTEQNVERASMKILPTRATKSKRQKSSNNNTPKRELLEGRPKDR